MEASSTMASTNSSLRDSGTSTRVSAEHVWPELMNDENTPPMAIVGGIGVVEDDVGRLAAELEADTLDGRRGGLRAPPRRPGPNR